MCFISACIHSQKLEPLTHYKVSKSRYSFLVQKNEASKPLDKVREAFLSEQKQLFAASDWQAVKSASLSYLEQHPHEELALEFLCLAIYQLNLPDLANYYADLLLSLNSTNPLALNIKGLLTIKKAEILNDYRQAISYFSKAMDSHPNEVAAGLNLGYTYLSLGNSTNASKVFWEVSKRCEACQVAQTGYAVALMRSGKSKKAMAIFAELSQENPENLVAKYGLARYHFQVSHNNADANKILREVFEKNHQNGTNEVLIRAKMLWKDQNKHNLF